ncbi:MAG: M23 family metallopeptidase [Rhizobiales bacterium]|nr:M23 family metallopeptidase [Hyphomicrobiales bacterium]
MTLTRGERMRTFALRPAALYGIFAVIPALCALYVAATVYLVFRDDMLAGLMSRQAEMQYAYEDRIAALRVQIDRVTSRQLLDQDSFEGKVHDLLSRQAQLEARGSVVANLAQQAGFGREAVALPRAAVPDGQAAIEKTIDGKGRAAAPVRASMNPLLKNVGQPQLPAGVTGFAPLQAPAARLEQLKPAPIKPTPADAETTRTRTSDAVDQSGDLPIPQRLGHIAQSLDQLEVTQIRELSSVESKARATAEKLRRALADAGLSADKIAAPASARGVGGPFVPLKVDPNGSLFEREVSRLQSSLIAVDRLKRVMPFVPLRTPTTPDAEQTSGFGARVDPFLGRAAMHSGVDFRGDVGSPIRATAGGTVVTAGWSGGYGNMVEIEHANGITTRYAHMSAINVSEGQTVEAGAVVGKLGSTGRSTGPHLHYEVRIDGDAVDPARFLRAGRALFARTDG